MDLSSFLTFNKPTKLSFKWMDKPSGIKLLKFLKHIKNQNKKCKKLKKKTKLKLLKELKSINIFTPC